MASEKLKSRRTASASPSAANWSVSLATGLVPPRPFWQSPLIVALTCLALSVFFFAPRLWLMTEYLPGTFQWDRAHTYLLQCEQPLRRDVEPAMLWRLLPPLVAYAAHLPRKTPLALPWLGAFACTAYVASLLLRRLPDPRYVYGGTLLFATTSAVLVPVGWFGINDAWVWLGLLAVAFGRSAWALPVACLLCPWVDERFIIGFPLAWVVRCLDRSEPILARASLNAFWLAPYAATRLGLACGPWSTSATAQGFVHDVLVHSQHNVPLAMLAWWMGLRAAWIAIVYAVWAAPQNKRLATAVAIFTTMLVSLVLAADMSRSIAILTPVALWGCFEFARREPAHAPRVMLLVGIVNLLLPSAHVIRGMIDPINLLPIELIRALGS